MPAPAPITRQTGFIAFSLLALFGMRSTVLRPLRGGNRAWRIPSPVRRRARPAVCSPSKGARCSGTLDADMRGANRASARHRAWGGRRYVRSLVPSDAGPYAVRGCRGRRSRAPRPRPRSASLRAWTGSRVHLAISSYKASLFEIRACMSVKRSSTNKSGRSRATQRSSQWPAVIGITYAQSFGPNGLQGYRSTGGNPPDAPWRGAARSPQFEPATRVRM